MSKKLCLRLHDPVELPGNSRKIMWCSINSNTNVDRRFFVEELQDTDLGEGRYSASSFTQQFTLLVRRST